MLRNSPSLVYRNFFSTELGYLERELEVFTNREQRQPGIWTTIAGDASMVGRRFGGAVAQLGARLDGIEEVVGSNPIGSTNLVVYGPETSFTERSEDILYTLGPKGLF